MEYRVKITETYTYTKTIKTDDDIDEYIHDIPILIDMDKEDIETIKEDKTSEFDFYNEFEVLELE